MSWRAYKYLVYEENQGYGPSHYDYLIVEASDHDAIDAIDFNADGFFEDVDNWSYGIPDGLDYGSVEGPVEWGGGQAYALSGTSDEDFARMKEDGVEQDDYGEYQTTIILQAYPIENTKTGSYEFRDAADAFRGVVESEAELEGSVDPMSGERRSGLETLAARKGWQSLFGVAPQDGQRRLSPLGVVPSEVAKRTRMLADVDNDEVDEIIASRQMGDWSFGEGGLRDLYDRFTTTSEYGYDLSGTASWAAPRSRLSAESWSSGPGRLGLEQQIDFIPFGLPGQLGYLEGLLEHLTDMAAESGEIAFGDPLGDESVRDFSLDSYRDYLDGVFGFARGSKGGFYREYARYLLAKIKASYAGEWESDGED
jgi:hypothetical protein